MANSLPSALHPHQLQFLEAWSTKPGRNMALLWPAGAGVVGAIGVLVADVDPSQRVLVIADRYELMHQIVFQLKAAGVTAQVVDRYAYRQLQSEAGGEAMNWRGSRVFALTASLASQTDVLPILARQQWGLVVLLDTSTAVTARLSGCITSATTHMLWKLRPGSDVASVDTGQWVLNRVSVSELASAKGLSTAEVPSIAIHVLSVQASVSEGRVLSSVEYLIKVSRGTSGERLATSMRARWMSSPAALESGLRRLKARLGADWPLWSTEADDADEEGPHDGESALGGDLAAVHEAIRSCFSELDRLDSDSKLRCLVDQLRTRESSQSTAVFVRYRDTGSYLQAALEDLKVPSILIHGAMTTSEIYSRMREFLEQRGVVLVMTTAMLAGADLRTIRNLILYDPPASREVMSQLLARFHVVGMPQLHVSVVTDPREANWMVGLIKEASQFVF